MWLKIFGILGLLLFIGALGIFRWITQQENLLFKTRYHKKSKDQEAYEEVNPIWKDRRSNL